MPTAYLTIRDQPVYRRGAFEAGLKACGYSVEYGGGPRSPEDVLIIWNRYGDRDELAKRFEAIGARVLVAENSPLGREWRGSYWYSISRNRHNGCGTWYVGGAERWESWNVGLKPWRRNGSHILVLPQRGIGVAPFRQPNSWRQSALECLKNSARPIKVREHPGTAKPNPVDHGLLQDLQDAWCTVTWGSGAALKGLVEGIPCFYSLKGWIGALASEPFGHDLEEPYLGDRRPCFERLAWSIWNVDEIKEGVPFRLLLSTS